MPDSKEQRNKVKDTYSGKEIEVLIKTFWSVAPTVHHLTTNGRPTELIFDFIGFYYWKQ